MGTNRKIAPAVKRGPDKTPPDIPRPLAAGIRTHDQERLTYEITQHDHYAQPDALFVKEDPAPLVAQRQLHEVLVHQPRNHDPVII